MRLGHHLARHRMYLVGILVAAASLPGTFASTPSARAAEVVLREGDGLRWFKGNTHTHTFWSDGDAAPEFAVDWYKSHGYDFLCLTDHNVLATAEKWAPVGAKKSKVTKARVEELEKLYGPGWVVTRTEPDGTESMRLKTLAEVKARFESPEFLLIPAEEVSNPRAVHVNAVNIRETIPSIQGKDTADTLRKSFDLIEEHGRRHGVPVLAHLNHPNFSDGVTAEDIIHVGGERFFEVYNGHGGVRNHGDEAAFMPSVERMWDIILSMRLRDGDTDRPMWGLATDDTHAYYEQRIGLANAGRGWIEVLAAKLEPDALVEAMKAGRFYSSTGVSLDEVRIDEKEYRVSIVAEPGVTYRTTFVGTRKGFDPRSEPVMVDGKERPHTTRKYSGDVGVVLLETDANPAVYPFAGDELYVRAKVTSSRLQPNPHVEGDFESAWAQPFAPK